MFRTSIARWIVLSMLLTLGPVAAMAQDAAANDPGDADQPQTERQRDRQRDNRRQRDPAQARQRDEIQARQRWDDFKKQFATQVNPTDEQKAGVQNAFNTYLEEMQAYRSQHRDALQAAMQKARQARRGNDAEAAKAAQADIETHRKARQEVFDHLTKQLDEVLSDEQMTKAKPLIKELAEGRNRQARRPQTPEELLQTLGLSESQQTKAKLILADAENQAAKTDDEALKASLRKDAAERVASTVLTPEQKQQYEQALARQQQRQRGGWGDRGGRGGPGENGQRGGQRGFRGPELNLTEEQQAQRDQIMADARQAMEGTEDRGERMRIFGDAMRKFNDEVLSDEQRQQLRQHMRQNGPLGRLGATDEQHEQAEAIMDEARKQAEQAETREARREIYRAAMERVRDEVLTEEQREKAEEMRRQWQQRREERRQQRQQRREQRQQQQNNNNPAGEED